LERSGLLVEAVIDPSEAGFLKCNRLRTFEGPEPP